MAVAARAHNERIAPVRDELAMPRGISIRVQLARLVLAVALPLIGLEAWNLYAAAQSDSRQARAQVFHMAQVTGFATARFLGQAHNILNGLAARPAVRALDSSRCDPILKDFLGLAPRFTNVVTATLDGRVVCSAAPLAGPTRVDPAMFLKLLRGADQLTVGNATHGTITGRWAVPVGLPLPDAQGGVAGAVALTIDLLSFPVLPSVEGMPADAVVGLVAADGTVLAHSREPKRFVGTKAGAGRTPVREKTGTAEELGLDGILRVHGFTPVPGTDWIAVATLPASEVYAGVNARVVTSLLLAIAILCAALLLTVHWGRKIREPITALADAADQVAAGNLAARAQVAGTAEIAEVATQFNRMLDSRARTEAQLRESAGKLQLFIHYAPSAIAMFDREMRYIAYSQRWIADYKLADRGDITGRSHYEIFPELPERWKDVHRRCLAGAVELADEDPFPRDDGSVDWVRWEVHPWHTNAREIGGIIIFSEVITERKRAEEALGAYTRRLQDMSRRLLEAQEAERRNINRELHDRIGQNLSVLNLNLKLIRSELPKDFSRATGARLDETQKLLEATTAQVRDVMAELHPPALDDYGLLAALRAHIAAFSANAATPVSVSGGDLAPRLPPAVEMALFRIAQEALANVARHARAKRAEVTLAASAERVTLMISDDGVGFDAANLSPARPTWGLEIMRERAEAAGATLTVESAPGKGTRVCVEVSRGGGAIRRGGMARSS